MGRSSFSCKMADSEKTRVGQIVGRTRTDLFSFVANQDIKRREFVYVEHEESLNKRVLCQVGDVEFNSGKLVVHCKVIGFKDQRGLLRTPRIPISGGADVYLAEEKHIKEVLDLKERGLYLGYLDGKKIGAYLDPDKLISRHLAVMAKSGAGKSYAVGVVLEELMEVGAPVVVIDPHGEYDSLRYPNDSFKDLELARHYEVKPKGYGSKVALFALSNAYSADSTPLRFNLPQDPNELSNTFPLKFTYSQKSILYQAVRDLVQNRERFDLSELIEVLKANESASKWQMISELEKIRELNIFSLEQTAVNKIVRPGQLSIINLKGERQEVQEVVAALLLEKLFHARKLEEIPPFFLVIEEAHNFAPERSFNVSKSSKIIRTIAAEGRKFGISLAIVSQRPARVDKSVLSQCNSQLILQVTNPNDLRALTASFEEIGPSTEADIQGLPVGKALVVGVANMPIFIEVRVRKSKHGGVTQKLVLDTEVRGDGMFFEPTISVKDIYVLEGADIDRVSMLFLPCLLVEGEGDRFCFSLVSGNLIDMDEGGKLVELLLPKMKFSPNQSRILNVIREKGRASVADCFLVSGLSFSECSYILRDLFSSKILDLEGDKYKLGASLEKLSISGNGRFVLKPKLLSLAGDFLPEKKNRGEIENILASFGIKNYSLKKVYLPFYRVERGSDMKIRDAISYSLELARAY